MPALVSFASVLRRSRYRLDISNPVSLLRLILCLRQPPKLIVKDPAKDPSYLKTPLPSSGLLGTHVCNSSFLHNPHARCPRP